MAFDKTLPIEGALAPTYNNIMRADKTALEAALNAYMYFATGGTQTGQPRQGSCRIYYQDTAPATRLDGDYFDSTDFGCLWIDSNSTIDNQFNWLSAADGAGTDTWTPVSTEIIAFLVAQANAWAGIQTFSVAPVFTIGIVANDAYLVGRNNAGDGNIDIVKVNTSDGITLGAVTTLPDTSALATSGAPVADAQLTNKKFVNDQDTAAKTAVGWTHDGSTAVNLTTLSTTYQDVNTGIGGRGIVFLKVKSTQNTLYIFLKTKGETDTSSTEVGEGMGCSAGRIKNGEFFHAWVETDANGYVQAVKAAGTDSNVTITVMGYLLTP